MWIEIGNQNFDLRVGRQMSLEGFDNETNRYENWKWGGGLLCLRFGSGK